ncbi:glycosyltransferase [Cognataquiflexum rubidum]|uniref:glycosyltransferase n=1 Tax=Cognataquiflexum rubidum TaxID=2922273 RepID=UPI001F12CD94|nr:glycosyltransferase [Cognataquiflexum rubidum]MCH6234039.1 glycosyltransferase [Cognataquiflexum rubidum]
MPRFARMLGDGMQGLGHQVEYWMPKARFFNLPGSTTIKKWLGYVDQYIIFPAEVKLRLKNCPQDTLFVFTDHALGPWVPLVANRLHVIHCHDFLAQKSALGDIPENPTSWTGRQYQAYIRRGYIQGRNFISVSEKTRNDLHEFLPIMPQLSEVVFNGLNQNFKLIAPLEARKYVEDRYKLNLYNGCILHVGGNQWYKNRIGVISIYNAWRKLSQKKIPLLLVGPFANSALLDFHSQSPYKSDIHLLSGMDDTFVRHAYAGASLMLFPSLAEGFGWPIAEAMASGCPVITTNEAPMIEVGGEAAFYIPRMPAEENDREAWSKAAADKVEEILEFAPEGRAKVVEAGVENTKRFDSKMTLARINGIYQKILQNSLTG